MPAVTVLQAAERFHDFYVPRFEITASGAGLDPAVLRDVTQVTYNDSISEIDSFDITVGNWDPALHRFKYTGAETSVMGATAIERLFNPDAGEFELKLGYGSELSTLVRGSTTSLEPTFPSSGASTLTVRLLNVLHRLRTKQNRDAWPNRRVPRAQAKISCIAQDVGARTVDGCRFPLPIRISESALRSEPLLDHLAQDNQFDIDFLLLQARQFGYVVYVDQEPIGRGRTREVLYFGPSDARHPGVPDVSYELEWGKSLIDFTPKLSTANQVSAVEVRSWNRQTNRAINERIDIAQLDAPVNEDLQPLIRRTDKCREREHIAVTEPQFTPEQARRRATSLLSERLKQLVEANGTTVGLPDLRAGQRIQVRGLGARFSGVYFVTKTTHTINESGYLTKFTARREAPLPGPAAGAAR
jgi:phage protein D